MARPYLDYQSATLWQRLVGVVVAILSIIAAIFIGIVLLYIVLFFVGLAIVIAAYFFIRRRFFMPSPPDRHAQADRPWPPQNPGDGIVIDGEAKHVKPENET
ncbi:MAG: hypothetical protein ACFBZ9_17735 [Sphingomonadales bacterium]